MVVLGERAQREARPPLRRERLLAADRWRADREMAERSVGLKRSVIEGRRGVEHREPVSLRDDWFEPELPDGGHRRGEVRQGDEGLRERLPADLGHAAVFRERERDARFAGDALGVGEREGRQSHRDVAEKGRGEADAAELDDGAEHRVKTDAEAKLALERMGDHPLDEDVSGALEVLELGEPRLERLPACSELLGRADRVVHKACGAAASAGRIGGLDRHGKPDIPRRLLRFLEGSHEPCRNGAQSERLDERPDLPGLQKMSSGLERPGAEHADLGERLGADAAPLRRGRTPKRLEPPRALGEQAEGAHGELGGADRDEAGVRQGVELPADGRGAPAGDPGDEDGFVGLHRGPGDLRHRRIKRGEGARPHDDAGAVDAGVLEHRRERRGEALAGRARADDDGVDRDALARMRLVQRLDRAVGESAEPDPRGVGRIRGERGDAAAVGDDRGAAACGGGSRGEGRRRGAEVLVRANAQSPRGGEEGVEGAVVARIRAEAACGEPVRSVARARSGAQHDDGLDRGGLPQGASERARIPERGDLNGDDAREAVPREPLDALREGDVRLEPRVDDRGEARARLVGLVHEARGDHRRLRDERDAADGGHARPEARVDADPRRDDADRVGAEEARSHRAGGARELRDLACVRERPLLLGREEHRLRRIEGEPVERPGEVLAAHAQDREVDRASGEL